MHRKGRKKACEIGEYKEEHGVISKYRMGQGEQPHHIDRLDDFRGQALVKDFRFEEHILPFRGSDVI